MCVCVRAHVIVRMFICSEESLINILIVNEVYKAGEENITGFIQSRSLFHKCSDYVRLPVTGFFKLTPDNYHVISLSVVPNTI